MQRQRTPKTNPGVKKYVCVYCLSNSKKLTKPSVMVIIHQITLEITANNMYVNIIKDWRR